MAFGSRLAGRAARLYWRVARPRTFGVRAIVVDDRRRVALVRHTYLPGWYLPGGGVNKGESAQAALARELREELLLEIAEVERILGLYHSRREFKDDHIGVYVVHPVRASDPLSIGDAREIAEAAWFAPEALPDETSPATARRITEYLGRTPAAADW